MQVQKLTYEQALANFRAGQAKKRAYIANLRKAMESEYERTTGSKATNFSVL